MTQIVACDPACWATVFEASFTSDSNLKSLRPNMINNIREVYGVYLIKL